MGQIAEASAEQSRGVQQVNKTVTEMDKVVQQNASAVQQSAAAAEGMRQQAESLVRAVGAFRIDGDARAPQAPALGHSADTHVRQESHAALPQARSTAPVRAQKPAPVAAGDDWEEF